jgi:DNA-binding helix-hairpin-helix protein with protein kinase domain
MKYVVEGLHFCGPVEVPEDDLSEPLGSGLTASIHRIRGDLALAKVFFDPSVGLVRRQKLDAMLLNPPFVPYRFSLEDTVQFAWPEGLLLTPVGRDCVGFVMPEARGAITLEEMLYDEEKPYDRSIQARLTTAKNIAKGVAQLHVYGHLLVDAKPANILVYPQTRAVCFIDCDGYGITSRDDRFFPAEEMTDSYAAPELLIPQRRLPRNRYEEYPDRFSLGVLVFELLAGVHPYDGVFGDQCGELLTRDDRIVAKLYPYAGLMEVRPPPDSDYAGLPAVIRGALDLSVGLGAPQLRPSAADWLSLLEAAAHMLDRCPDTANLGSHLWFKGEECPRCSRGRQGQAGLAKKHPPELGAIYRASAKGVGKTGLFPHRFVPTLLLIILVATLVVLAFGVFA